MADVTINDLSSQAPTTSDLFPFSTAVSPSTYKASLAQIKTALAIPAAQIQSDWTQANTSALDYIKNKPTIPTSTGLGGIQGFTTAGNYTFTAPAGVTKVKVTVQGGGGGAGGITSNFQCGGNVGASGGYAIGMVNVVAGTSYAVVVGGAGAGGGLGGCGGTGGTSSFNDTSIYATGGTGGCPCGAAGTAGTGVNGQINMSGASLFGGFGWGSSAPGTGTGQGCGAGQRNGCAGGAGFVMVEW